MRMMNPAAANLADNKKAELANGLENLDLKAVKITDLSPTEYKGTLDVAAAKTWDAAPGQMPWMKYALWGAAAYLVYKFVLKK